LGFKRSGASTIGDDSLAHPIPQNYRNPVSAPFDGKLNTEKEFRCRYPSDKNNSLGETPMTTNTSLEERIAAVEAAITELQKQVANPQQTNWLQQITGSFKDEPAFEEVLALGQTIRQGNENVKLF